MPSIHASYKLATYGDTESRVDTAGQYTHSHSPRRHAADEEIGIGSVLEPNCMHFSL